MSQLRKLPNMLVKNPAKISPAGYYFKLQIAIWINKVKPKTGGRQQNNNYKNRNKKGEALSIANEEEQSNLRIREEQIFNKKCCHNNLEMLWFKRTE